MVNLVLVILVVLALAYYIGKELIKYANDKRVYREHQIKEAEKEKEREIKLIGQKIINRPELDDGIRKVITKAVKIKVRSLRSTYFDCDEVNIWTTSIFTFQLQCELEEVYGRAKQKVSGELANVDEVKEFVREIIKVCHLEAVRMFPELKEY